jgi:hypothetical protein
MSSTRGNTRDHHGTHCRNVLGQNVDLIVANGDPISRPEKSALAEWFVIQQRAIHASAVSHEPLAIDPRDFRVLAGEVAVVDGNRATRRPADRDPLVRQRVMPWRECRTGEPEIESVYTQAVHSSWSTIIKIVLLVEVRSYVLSRRASMSGLTLPDQVIRFRQDVAKVVTRLEEHRLPQPGCADRCRARGLLSLPPPPDAPASPRAGPPEP